MIHRSYIAAALAAVGLAIVPAILAAQTTSTNSEKKSSTTEIEIKNEKLRQADQDAANKIKGATEKASETTKKIEEKTGKINDRLKNTQEDINDASKRTTEQIKKATIKKNTRFTRGYHNFTGYFNVYFNSKDAFNAAMRIVDKKFPYDFSTILPVFPFKNDSIPAWVKEWLERCQEKANKTIKTHSITTKPKTSKGRMSKKEQAFYNKHEFCVWVSEAIIHIGLANVYLQENTLARMAFSYVASEYPEDPNSYRAKIWMGLLEGADDNVSGEENILQPLLTDRHFPKEYVTLRNEAMADLMIRQKNYPKAIKFLEQALEKRWKLSVVLRYHYILAQLYQQTGNHAKSAQHYRRVMRSWFAPEKMKINATINYSYMADGRASAMRKKLLDMVQQKQYEDYQDLLYFALAQLEEQQKNQPQAIEYYVKALETNKGGNSSMQLAANYKLARYYEQQAEYEQAQKHYAATANLMPPSDADYKSVQNKAKNLNQLAQYLRTIAKQDTLQKIAKMTDSQRDAYVQKCIAQAQAADAKKAQELTAATNTGTSSAGTWYFYNPAIVEKGKEDFQKIWGNRPLTDNWRYSSGNENSETDENNSTDGSINNENSSSEKVYDADYCLRGMPTTAEELRASDDSLQAAMLGAAKVYRIYLDDNKNSIAMLENLLKRYPFTEYKMEAYFYLYTMYQKDGNQVVAEDYKQKLIAEFPDTELAESLRNPNYASKTELTKRQADTLYAQAYEQYLKQDYYGAQQSTQQGLSRYRELPIAANFALLQAMAKGNEAGLSGHVRNLQVVVSNYPNTDAAKGAQEMIDWLHQNEQQILEETTNEIIVYDTLPDGSVVERHEIRQKPTNSEGPAMIYSTEDGLSVVALAYDTRAVNINQLRFDVMVFNTDMDAMDLKVEVQPLSMDLKLLLVGDFQRLSGAVDYYRNIVASPAFSGRKGVTIFVITRENLELLMKERYISNYVEFFRGKILK